MLIGVSNSFTAVSIKVDQYAIMVAREPFPKIAQEDSRRYRERGMSTAQATRLFDANLSSVKRYARTLRQGDSLTPKWGTGRPRKLDKGVQDLLKEDVKEHSAATISQRRRFLEHITGTDPKQLHRQAADEAAGLHSKRTWGRWNETSGWEQLGE